MTEATNVFERRQVLSTLAEDRKTRFQKNSERRNSTLHAASTLAARIERNDRQHRAWSGDTRSGGARTTSVRLDAATAALKASAEDSRKSSPEPPPTLPAPPTELTICAIIHQFENNTPRYFRSAFNAANMTNFLLTNVAAGTLEWSYEAVSTAYQWLHEHGYLEAAPRTRKRGDPTSSAPKVFPPFISDELLVTQAETEQLARTAREVETALSTDFASLQRGVRRSLPQYGAVR